MDQFSRDGDPLRSALARTTIRRPRRRGIDYRALRAQVTISDVLRLLEWTPVRQRGPQWRGPCPVHRSTRVTSQVFAVNTERNTWFCHSPKCKTGGNQLDLYVAVTGLPLYQAAEELCQKLGVSIPSLSTEDR